MKSLKTKVIFSVMLLFTMIFPAFSYIGILYFKSKAIESVQVQQYELVNKLADEVNTKLAMLIRVLKATSETIKKSDFQNHESADDFLKRYKVLSSIFDDNVMIFDSKGRLLAETGDNDPARIYMSFMWRSYISETLATKKLFISPPIMAVASDKLKMPMVVIAEPVIIDKELMGIIVGSVNLYKKNIFDNSAFTTLNNKGWIYVADKNGNIIMHPDTRKITGKIDEVENPYMQDMLSSGFGSMHYKDGRGREIQASFKNIPSSDWMIVANYPSDSIFSHIYAAEANLIFFVMGGALLVFLILRFITRSLIKPLISLKEQVYELMSNPDSYKKISVSSNDEIKETAQAFNSLLAEIYKNRNELKQNNELLQTVFKFSSDWVYWVDAAGRLVYFSPAAGIITGYSDAEISNYPSFYEKIIHPDDYEKWLKVEQSARLYEDTVTTDIRMFHKNGSVIWLRSECKGIHENGQFIGIRGCYRDITETKAIEDQLRNSEKKYRILIQNSNSPIMLTDKDFKIVELNDKAYSILSCEEGTSALACLGCKTEELISRFKTEPGLLVADIESDLNVSGEVHHFLWRINSISKGSERTGFVVVGIDITSKVKMDEELSRMALRAEINKYTGHLEAIIKSVSDGIVSVDKNLRLASFNSVAEKLFDLKQDDIGKPLENINMFFANTLAGLVRKTAKQKEASRDIRLRFEKDGNARTLKFNLRPLTDIDGKLNGVLAVIADEAEHIADEPVAEFSDMVGTGQKMKDVFNLMRSLADVDSTVLVLGESGTGKELVASGIHFSGKRKNKPFIRLNCSAIPENLLESELFGHAKGSFTGAIADKPGKFEAANGGTIFLDEIGDISLSTQVKLLRVLQEKEIEVIGKNESIKVDVRVITATNKDLKSMVAQGTFREDLYYRLKVVSVIVPPLRERKEDIMPLVARFIHIFNRKMNKNIVDLTDDVRNAFMEYDWYGNVRELEHVVEHACLMAATSFIAVEDLPSDFSAGNILNPEIEKEQIENALISAKGYKAKAARILGISRATLYRKLNEYKIDY